MVKSAGFLKRLKNFGNKFIQGLDWVNDKIVKPVKNTLEPVINTIPYGSTINKVIDWGSNLIDNLADKSSQTRQLKGGKFDLW